jgi:hypothetical protein
VIPHPHPHARPNPPLDIHALALHRQWQEAAAVPNNPLPVPLLAREPMVRRG